MMDASLATNGSTVKPHMASTSSYRRLMAKDTHHAVDAALRAVLSANIKGLQRRYPGLASSPALARKAQIGQRTALRAMQGTHATTIDTLAAIASAFDVQAWQLLLPGFAGPTAQPAESGTRATIRTPRAEKIV